MCHWLGDTFWASQTLPFLQEKFPHSEIHIFLRKDFSVLFYQLVNPELIHLVPEVISDRKREKFSFSQLRKKAAIFRIPQYDLMIDLTGNRYSALFCHMLKPRFSIGFEGDELNGLYDLCVMPCEYASLPLWQRPFKVIEPLLEKPTAPLFPRPPATPCECAEVMGNYNLSSNMLAILAPCAGWPEKEWGDDNFIKLARQLKKQGYTVLITGAPNERERCQKIADAANSKLWDGKLGELFALLNGAACFIGNDSGLGHIAAAQNNSLVITLFTGETEPDKLKPRGERVIALHAAKPDFGITDITRLLPK